MLHPYISYAISAISIILRGWLILLILEGGGGLNWSNKNNNLTQIVWQWLQVC